jgi:hypothetical protein
MYYIIHSQRTTLEIPSSSIQSMIDANHSECLCISHLSGSNPSSQPEALPTRPIQQRSNQVHSTRTRSSRLKRNLKSPFQRSLRQTNLHPYRQLLGVVWDTCRTLELRILQLRPVSQRTDRTSPQTTMEHHSTLIHSGIAENKFSVSTMRTSSSLPLLNLWNCSNKDRYSSRHTSIDLSLCES